MTQRYTEANGDNDDLYNAPEHGDRAEVDALPDDHISEQGGHNGGKQGGYRCHSYRKGQVALADKGNYIGSGTSRTGTYQYHADRKGRVQVKSPGKGVGEKGHDGILGHRTQQYIPGSLQDQLEILQFHRGTHTEHDDAQHHAQEREAGQFSQYPGKSRRTGHTSDKEQDDNQTKILANQLT